MIIDGQNIDDMPQSFGYNGDGTLAYVQVVTPAIPGAYWAAGQQAFCHVSNTVESLPALQSLEQFAAQQAGI